MKYSNIRTLTAVSLIAAGSAQAQFLTPSVAPGSLRIYGVLDVAIGELRGSKANMPLEVAGVGYPSRIGFIGSEDLGSGLRSNFNLEAGLDNTSGAGIPSNSNNQASGAGSGNGLTFNRQSWVGLSSTQWGEVRAGRSFTPTYRNYLIYDPMAGGGPLGSQSAFGAIAASGNPGGIRSSNMVEYWSPELTPGLKTHLMYALGQNPSNSGVTADDGRYRGGRIQYVQGGFSAGFGAARYDLASVGGITEITSGVKYTKGAHTGHMMLVKNLTGTAGEMSGILAGYSYREGNLGLRMAYSTSRRTNPSGAVTADARKLAISPEYYLSPRTAIYIGYARIANANGSTATPSIGAPTSINGANGTSSFVSLGIVHSF